ncbi:MAG: CotH kinase family protein [Clostridia bacterium]|nr:CotH kinase family protein [Clostridia bacterium]MBR2288012.1 CotH kinase family protein [Clostridia bacterium]
MTRLLSLLLLLTLLLPLLPLPSLAESEGEIVISEVMASNGTWSGGHAYDWIELHNTGTKSVDLSGWGLSDSPKKPMKWTFPEGTRLKGNSYLLVYCTGEEMAKGKDSTFYANFKLSASGDDAILSDEDGQTVCALSFPAQYGNISYGIPASGGDYGYFESATPGKKNEATVYAARTSSPEILTPGGFYEGTVSAFAKGPEGALIRYTTDGSTPTVKSPLFPEAGVEIKATTALRVRAFRDNEVPSATVSATYLIGEDLPVAVVSLTTDESYLFGKKAGALAKGTGSVPNYDKPYEYPVNIEYFDEDGMCLINQVGSFTASGHSAKQNAQKSIALYARKAYGPEYFSFSPFPNRDYDQYKSILLRSTNSDAYSERLRDVVFTSLAEPLDLCYQDARPIVVFINGKYWGHYNLREKINKYMVAQWEGIDLEDEKTVDAIDVLARTGSDDYVQNGSNLDWLELCKFCKTKDLNDPENLAWVDERLDIDNLFTHASYEIISGNSDITNVRMYRVPGGKWKYLLFDVEASFGSGSDTDVTPLNNYIKPVSAKYAAFRHEPLNALLAVPEMKARFLTRFAEVLDSSFLWPYVEAHFAPWEEILEQLLPRHNQRWSNLTMKRWRTNVNATKYYARVRPKKIVSMLKKRMKLTNDEVELYFGEVQQKLDTLNTLTK